MCHREVALNRRLAPDVYLGVADVMDPSGVVCDHLIVMRRMPADRRLSTLVSNGADVSEDLWRLAHLLASFHARAERGPHADEAASVDATAQRWSTNTSEMRALSDRLLDGDVLTRIEGLAERYLAGRDPLFERRVAEGRACDGHGDLLADDIFCLDDGPRVLDCIEFDDRLRYGDVLGDVAFLAMDLERLDRPDLAAHFLRAYQEHAADTWPSSLAHHHIAYRAQVRAKVSAIRAAQGDADSARSAPQLLRLARTHLDAGRVRLVLIGGAPGTGKSTLAAALDTARDLTLLRSDEIRKELVGLRSDQPASASYQEGIYAPDTTRRTYEAMLQRARVALGFGETVALDASWTDEAQREAAREVAATRHADMVELCCVAPVEVAAQRMRTRAAAHDDPSDATPEIAAAMALRADPWGRARVVDTTSGIAAATECALLAFDDAD